MEKVLEVKHLKKNYQTLKEEIIALKDINFSVYDIAPIVNQQKNERKGLVDWCAAYKINLSSLQAHKSCDDAMMTMLLTKAFCAEQNCTLEELLEKRKDVKLSVEKYLEQREYKLYVDGLTKKINELFGKKSRAPLTQRLKGEYAFGFKLKSDIDEAFRLANLVYKHGGMLMKNLKKSGTIIMPDDSEKATIENMKKRGLSVLTVSEFDEIVRME